MSRPTSPSARAVPLLVVGLALGLVSIGRAQPPAPDAPSVEPDAARRRVIEELRERARRVDALIAGTLESDVVASTLFDFDLADPALTGDRGERFLELLTGAEASAVAAPRRRRAPTPAARPVDPDPLRATVDDLVAAYERFFALPIVEREALLAAHRERRAALAVAAEGVVTRRAYLRSLRERRARLEAFVRGELDPTVDPRTLLHVDLSASGGLGLDETRLSRALGAEPPPPEEVEDPETLEGAALAAAIEREEHRLDAARLSFLRRPASDRAALVAEQDARREAHQRALAGAEEAEVPEEAPAETIDEVDRAQQQALEEARQARSRAARALAEERARLLGVRAELARVSERVAARWTGVEADRAEGVALVEAARAVIARPELDLERPRDASRVYDQVRDALAKRLVAIRDILRFAPELPEVASSVDAQGEVDWTPVTELVTETTARHAEVESEIDGFRDRALDALGADVAALHRARLDLLPVLAADQRDRLTGFGPEGVEQASQELEHLTLFWRLKGRSLTRRVAGLASDVTTSIPRMTLVAIELLLLVVAFVFWRRHADGWLRDLEGPDPSSRRNLHFGAEVRRAGWMGLVAYYVRRVRAPLEWLILIFALSRLLAFEQVPEMRYVWIVTLWPLFGAVAVRGVDAYAIRDRRARGRRDADAELRARSLRLIGRVVVLVGLLLSLTEAAVGAGTLYAWVGAACWLLPIVVGVILSRWWRERIVTELGRRQPPSRLERWVLHRTTGVRGVLALLLGGAWWFALGTGAWLARELSRFEITRRVLAALFLRGLQRQAEGDVAPRTTSDLAPEVRAALAPGAVTEKPLAAVADAHLAALVELLEAPAPAMTAVIGERGLGKSTFLGRVARAVSERDVITLRFDRADVSGRAALAVALQRDPGAGDDELSAALAEQDRPVILVDDAHRLFRPAVHGYDGLRGLLETARGVGASADWVVTFDSAGWQYADRALGIGDAFDRVVSLQRWTESDIAELLRSRASAADVVPDFGALGAQRRAAGDDDEQIEEGFYRLVWDHSQGNPAVALHCFTQSLVERDDKTLVRLFELPRPESLEPLPPPAHFLLRALVQLDVASLADLAEATSLSAPSVEDLVRRLEGLGLLAAEGPGLRITWPWYRTVRTVLRRRHLLIVE
ncbi:MAG: ATP-binding protein [Sandaracinaceae bacterium]|nr:ATP-binding protein [Sandaracinaceae bacterium]